MPSHTPFFKGFSHLKTYPDGQCRLWNSSSGANKVWVKKMTREMGISFTLFEPHPLPTTSQLFRAPGPPRTLRASVPRPEAAAGMWKAGYSRSGVSGTASAVRWSWHRFCFLERAGTSRQDPATSNRATAPSPLACTPARSTWQQRAAHLPHSVLNDLQQSKT